MIVPAYGAPDLLVPAQAAAEHAPAVFGGAIHPRVLEGLVQPGFCCAHPRCAAYYALRRNSYSLLPVYMLMCSVLTALILRAIRATGRFDSRNLRRLLRCVLHFTADGTQGAGRPLGVRVRPVLSVADAGWAG